MGISFAGVDLLLEDPEGRLLRHVRRFLEWPRSQLSAPARTIDSKSRVQRPQWPDQPPLKPNQLYWPTGATRWSQFMGITTTADKDAILAALDENGAGVLTLSLPGDTAVPVDSANIIDGDAFNLHGTINLKMILLTPIPISIADDTVWILPLVDQRHTWQGKSFVSTATTWQGLLGEISACLGRAKLILDDTTTLGASYGVPDPCVFRNGQINAAAALDLLCWSTGKRFVTVNRQWNESTDYQIGDVVQNLGMWFTCTTAGTSGTGTGPDATGAVTDGSVEWTGAASGPTSYVLRSAAGANALYELERTAQLDTSGSGGSAAGGDFDPFLFGDLPASVDFVFTNDGETNELTYTADIGAPLNAVGQSLSVMCPAVFTGSNNAELEALADAWAASFWAWGTWRLGSRRRL